MEMPHWVNYITGVAVLFLQTQYLTPHSFPSKCVHLVSHLASPRNWGNKTYNTSWLQTLSI